MQPGKTSSLSFDEVVRKAAEEEARHRGLGGRKTDLYAEFQEKYFWDPAGFARDCIQWEGGEGLAPYQDESLDALIKHRRYAIRGPHGLGKTTIAAILVLWFALTRDGAHDWKVPTTAGAWRQLEQYLWPEVHKWEGRLDWTKIGRDPFTVHESLDLSLKLETGRAFAVASDRPKLIEGAHADQVMFIYDEAKAITDETFDASEGALSADGVGNKVALALMSSTPGAPAGRFYQVHSRAPGYEDWTPRHVKREEVIAAGRMSEAWADKRKEQWGENSALYKNRVLGEFAADEENAIIPLSWIEEANERWHLLSDRFAAAAQEYEDALDREAEEDELEEIKGRMRPPLSVLAIDVADSGKDKTVLGPRYGRNFVGELKSYSKGDVMETAGRACAVLRQHPAYAKLGLEDAPDVGGMDEEEFTEFLELMEDAPICVVDAIGVGTGTAARLKELGVNVLPFVASQAARRDGKDILDRTGVHAFANRRAAVWWNLRDLLDPSYQEDIALPPDPMLTGDLTGPTYRHVSGGRILVESKQDINKRLGRSTDHGDTAVMAFADLVFGAPRQLHWIEVEDEPDEDMGLGKALEL